MAPPFARIRRYRQEMGLETLFPKPNLSKPANGPEHKVYPYLLRGLVINHPNQVWGVDITYIRLVNGWMYLVAFLDWYSRFVVAWELSDTLDAQSCLKQLSQDGLCYCLFLSRPERSGA